MVFIPVSGGPRGGALGAPPSLFLDQTKARMAEKKKFWRPPPPPPPPLSEGLDPPLPVVLILQACESLRTNMRLQLC